MSGQPPVFGDWEIIEISLPLNSESAVYPGDPPVHLESLARPSDPYRLSALQTSLHAGTHLDAPSHFIAGGATIDALPIERFLLPARVITVVAPDGCIGTQAIAADLHDMRGRALLLRTLPRSAELPRESAYPTDHAWLSIAAAKAIVAAGITLVGIDAPDVDRHGDASFGVHRCLLGAGIVLLEHIDLRRAADGDYQLVALPLRLSGAEASPVRAVLLKPT